MPTRPRRRPWILPFTIAVLLLGCGPNAASPRAEPPIASGSAEPTRQDSAGSVDPGTSDAPAVGQTDTEWGRIWDTLPAGFPTYPGSTPSDDASSEVVSGRFAIVGGDPAEIASWMQTGLEAATYSTEALSGPLEDGSFVLDSVGEAGCRIQTTIAPLGRLTFVSIRYGAACPLA